MRADGLVDVLVAAVNAGPRMPLDEGHSPASVLVGEPDHYGCHDWRIKPCSSIDWIEPLEQRLTARFPPLYRVLVTRYIFPSFELGQTGVFLFGNTPEGTDEYELRVRMFADPYMSPFLLNHGYLQFGSPDTGSYDPICFDMNRRCGSDHPIVRIDHEEILCHDRIRASQEIASSFRALIERAIPQWLPSGRRIIRIPGETTP